MKTGYNIVKWNMWGQGIEFEKVTILGAKETEYGIKYLVENKDGKIIEVSDIYLSNKIKKGKYPLTAG